MLTASPKIVGVALVGLGIVVLLGWALGIDAIKSVMLGFETMKPITALTFIFSGMVLILRARAWHVQIPLNNNAELALSLTILAIGVLTLVGVALGADFYVGDFLLRHGWEIGATSPMSTITALEFALFGFAMLLAIKWPQDDLGFVVLTFVGMLISLLVFAGYLYKLPMLYAPVPKSSIALHTAIGFFFLFVGTAMTRPRAGWVALLSRDAVTGAFAFWLLPALVVLPIGLGWVLNQAINASLISAPLGVDIFALSGVFFLSLVAWRTGVIANRLGRNIELHEELEVRLREMRKTAEEAAEAKSDFLANMTHELRTPLNSIIGFAGLLAKSADLQPADRRYVEIVEGSSHLLLALVNDVLDFSSLEASTASLHPVPFSLQDLVKQIATKLSLMARDKGLAIAVECTDNVSAAHFGDDMRMRQILVNLVNNAIKFTSKGSVTIVVSASEHSDSVQHLRIEVRDTGIGIASSKLKELFRRFSQADTSIHGRFGGTGLGLAISKHLVELMGGEIGVDSVEGVGTTFWFTVTLPRVDASALLEKMGSEMESQARGKRILVVDDVDLNRELVQALLTPYGHTINQATDGAEAVMVVSETDYDLVLMDVQMPGMDGLAATRAIRAMDGYGELPIVAMTAQALAPQIDACHAAGMNDYLAKPITPAALIAVVDKWTDRSRCPTAVAAEQEDAVADLRDQLLAECAAELTKAKALLVSGSPEARQDLQGLIHRLAGTAGMLGLAEIGLEARKLEMALAAGASFDSADCRRLVANLEASLRAA